MNSIWTESVEMPKFKQLDGDIRTDVLIIGGGLAGILCAYFLQQRGVDYALAEGRTLCGGNTKNTTAKITAQHGAVYHKLLNKFGVEKTKLYLEANQKAVQQYFELCKNIDCDFEEKKSYIYSVEDEKKLEQEMRALEKIGLSHTIVQTPELPFQTVGAIAFEKQAQFHPLKFVAGLAQGLNIYENTFVTKLSEDTAATNKGNIRFKKLIFATHFPIDNKHGMYFMKMYQHRSYVIALKGAKDVHGMYMDENKKGMSFRNYKEYLLIGGGAHRTGKKGGDWRELREFAKKYYPGAEEKYFWAAQDCMTLDHSPYIGVYAKRMPTCYVATGFNKWGVSSSMAAAMLLADLIEEKENPYLRIFNPSRRIFKPQLFLNLGETVINFLSPAVRRCPHLGCTLKWNDAEHSWDCPCHGSRFGEDGGLIDNPANGDLKMKSHQIKEKDID